MSELTVTKIINTDKPADKSIVWNALQTAFKSEFRKVKVKEKPEGYDLTCRVKTKLFNPIVSLNVPVTIQVKENKAKIMIDGKVKGNGWFVFTALIGFACPPIIWIMMMFMYSSQKKACAESLNNVMKKVDYDLASF